MTRNTVNLGSFYSLPQRCGSSAILSDHIRVIFLNSRLDATQLQNELRIIEAWLASIVHNELFQSSRKLNAIRKIIIDRTEAGKPFTRHVARYNIADTSSLGKTARLKPWSYLRNLGHTQATQIQRFRCRLHPKRPQHSRRNYVRPRKSPARNPRVYRPLKRSLSRRIVTL